MYLALISVVALVLIAYWLRLRAWEQRDIAPFTFALLPLMLVLLVIVETSADELLGDEDPVLLAIAADVSLSMGTIPEPVAHGEIGTRLARAQQALLPMLAQLGAAARPAMISITAFTSKSETILAWDDDLSLVREIIEYVLSTGLLTEAGSDIGVALNGVVPIYESLPDAYRDPARPKFLILVSDGEQTVSRASSDAALSKLRELGVRIISLHVGNDEPPEGLPVYDERDSFVGFEEVDGRIFSIPDPELMRTVAGGDARTGLFVHADSTDAASRILNFIGLQTAGPVTNVLRVGAVMLLWASIMIGLARYGFEE